MGNDPAVVGTRLPAGLRSNLDGWQFEDWTWNEASPFLRGRAVLRGPHSGTVVCSRPEPTSKSGAIVFQGSTNSDRPRTQADQRIRFSGAAYQNDLSPQSSSLASVIGLPLLRPQPMTRYSQIRDRYPLIHHPTSSTGHESA